ncbi:MAG: hypothetical protein WKF30_02110 [Pyrinomonadaceae bacterium]
MQAGAVAASVAFCALAGMAAFNSEINLAGTRVALRPAQSPRQQLATSSAANLYTQDEVDQLVAQRERDVRSAFAIQTEAGGSQIIQAQARRKQIPLKDGALARSNGSGTVRVNQSPRTAPNYTLRPQPNALDDEDEPRLSDLLSQVT